MQMRRNDVALREIQGNIVPGFRKDHQEFLFLRFPDEASGRAWTHTIYSQIASAWEVATFNRLYSAVKHPPMPALEPVGWTLQRRKERSSAEVTGMLRSTWLNVAFTAKGLETLGADLTGFSRAFTDGLFQRTTTGTQPFIFGQKATWTVRDSTGGSGAGGGEDTLTHAVLLVGADTAEDLSHALAQQYRQLAEHRVDLVISFSGQTLGDGRVHFGFRDGLSQPEPDDVLDGWTKRSRRKKTEQLTQPGEFILGCENESGEPPTEHELARHGSYLVFLNLEQDVAQFRRVMREQSEHLTVDGVRMTPELLAAKVVGRWPSGAKIKKQADSDPYPKAKPLDDDLQIWNSDFTQDPRGDGCPLFSHIRKVHPRGEAVDGVSVQTKQHRIIRRGIPYGRPFADGDDPTEGGRGLLFVSYQASIEQQFEHILRKWANHDNFPRRPLGMGWDSLIGFESLWHESLDTKYTLRYHHRGQGEGKEDFSFITLERFIRARDGGYFFSPSISGLAALAAGQFRP